MLVILPLHRWHVGYMAITSILSRRFMVVTLMYVGCMAITSMSCRFYGRYIDVVLVIWPLHPGNVGIMAVTSALCRLYGRYTDVMLVIWTSHRCHVGCMAVTSI
jgi:hypothetical protein